MMRICSKTKIRDFRVSIVYLWEIGCSLLLNLLPIYAQSQNYQKSPKKIQKNIIFSVFSKFSKFQAFSYFQTLVNQFSKTQLNSKNVHQLNDQFLTHQYSLIDYQLFFFNYLNFYYFYFCLYLYLLFLIFDPNIILLIILTLYSSINLYECLLRILIFVVNVLFVSFVSIFVVLLQCLSYFLAFLVHGFFILIFRSNSFFFLLELSFKGSSPLKYDRVKQVQSAYRDQKVDANLANPVHQVYLQHFSSLQIFLQNQQVPFSSTTSFTNCYFYPFTLFSFIFYSIIIYNPVKHFYCLLTSIIHCD